MDEPPFGKAVVVGVESENKTAANTTTTTIATTTKQIRKPQGL